MIEENIFLTNVQATLVSGTNIKTINSVSLLGSGDIPISSTNFANGNLTLTADRTHDFASKQMTWNNVKQFKLIATVAPPIGEASVRFQGFGNTIADRIAAFFNGSGQEAFRINGDRSIITGLSLTAGTTLTAGTAVVAGTTISSVNTYTQQFAETATATKRKFIDIRNTAHGSNVLQGFANSFEFVNRNISGAYQPDYFQHRLASATGVAFNIGAFDFFLGNGTGGAATHCLTMLGDKVGFGQLLPTARLDIKAQGALSTDLVQRIRNSADTGDLFSVNGVGDTIIKGNLTVTTSGLGTNTLNANLNQLQANSNTISGRLELLGSAGSSTMLDITVAAIQSGFQEVFQRTAYNISTSGNNALFYGIHQKQTLNFTTSGTNNIYRGFYHNPTITSLTNTEHRAIDVVTGKIKFPLTTYTDNATATTGLGGTGFLYKLADGTVKITI